MRDFNARQFNPQPEPPADPFGFATNQPPPPPPPFNPGLTSGFNPVQQIALLLPAVQA